jgi:hypothetical protein
MQLLAGGAGVRRAPPSAVAVRTADFDPLSDGAEGMRIMHQDGAGIGPAPAKRRRRHQWSYRREGARSHSILSCDACGEFVGQALGQRRYFSSTDRQNSS